MAETPGFRTFHEMVSVLARNTPHALILDWWRRLDRGIDYYFAASGLRRPSHPSAVEATLEADPDLEPSVAAQVRNLRHLRNAIAHEETNPIPADEAYRYAETAWTLGWQIASDPGDHEPAMRVLPNIALGRKETQ